ncbi:zinc finger, C3HC4 type (RING finger) domain-containing protein [Cardiosporidium cionae]|uniref:RING-type E3 ubiquitin transferase n=1 Tax=Cardiosporidium cionae TaxID=476202 RepID=A0ABQ7JGI2_9APIC|nr:zinc finger, C3HC4 type (RING finger) domain-containing protein [Cardiosporidium cionae]|eukprot:KAF8822990.1 zinc finger, C3HC4 type (RING finger) domain-containing protein [Cardiosporidium cionae]
MNASIDVPNFVNTSLSKKTCALQSLEEDGISEALSENTSGTTSMNASESCTTSLLSGRETIIDDTITGSSATLINVYTDTLLDSSSPPPVYTQQELSNVCMTNSTIVEVSSSSIATISTERNSAGFSSVLPVTVVASNSPSLAPLPIVVPHHASTEEPASVDLSTQETRIENLPDFMSGQISTRSHEVSTREPDINLQLPQLISSANNLSSSRVTAPTSTPFSLAPLVPLPVPSPPPLQSEESPSRNIQHVPLPRSRNPPFVEQNFTPPNFPIRNDHRRDGAMDVHSAQPLLSPLPRREDTRIESQRISSRSSRTPLLDMPVRSPPQPAGNVASPSPGGFPLFYLSLASNEAGMASENPRDRNMGVEASDDTQRVNPYTRQLQDASGSTMIDTSLANVVTLSKGVNMQIIQLFPEELFDADKNIAEVQRSCGICKMEYTDQDILRRLPCWHAFHSTCIDKWLEGQKTCPLCRFQVDLGLMIDTSEVSYYSGGEIPVDAMLFVQESELSDRLYGQPSRNSNGPMLGPEEGATEGNSRIAVPDDSNMSSRVFPMIATNQQAVVDPRLLASAFLSGDNDAFTPMQDARGNVPRNSSSRPLPPRVEQRLANMAPPVPVERVEMPLQPLFPNSLTFTDSGSRAPHLFNLHSTLQNNLHVPSTRYPVSPYPIIDFRSSPRVDAHWLQSLAAPPLLGIDRMGMPVPSPIDPSMMGSHQSRSDLMGPRYPISRGDRRLSNVRPVPTLTHQLYPSGVVNPIQGIVSSPAIESLPRFINSSYPGVTRNSCRNATRAFPQNLR